MQTRCKRTSRTRIARTDKPSQPAASNATGRHEASFRELGNIAVMDPGGEQGASLGRASPPLELPRACRVLVVECRNTLRGRIPKFGDHTRSAAIATVVGDMTRALPRWWVPPSASGLCERAFLTSEGHSGSRLQRALAAGNLTVAEQAAFEVAFVPLAQPVRLLSSTPSAATRSTSGLR